ncbi:zinc metallopeptidase [Enterococcus asini]|uniref:zinc metallopeptidase n=1 Tax=Enterococcus asini TaxID=57732 RepID=UPI0028906F89|nr:zinc metallopeptidase [Enterococcus asini]MDT2756361.1 zinc metallopeptidase [Enterococcus asini]
MYGFGYGLFDGTFILVIIGMGLSLAASAYVKSTFSKYDQVKSVNQVTGTKAAQYILSSQGIHNVGVQQISGDLTDNYDSRNKMLSLSQSTAQSTSVAAIGVAAHECGHAVQDAKNYLPLRLRAAIVPVATIGSQMAMPIILIGLLLQTQFLIQVGLIAFSLAFLFQVVTLPVEFNASRRALAILGEGGLLTEEELPQARKVLIAAALTYVAAAISTLLQLLRLVILFGGRRDD